MNLSFTEENYLKIIYSLSISHSDNSTSTNEISEKYQTKPSSVSDMLKKLSEKNLIEYERYKRVSLTREGTQLALQILRKHRLWEVFLYQNLHFTWDEVHELAEQLEHIRSTVLIDRLDEFLGFPEFDPHGDPIPNAFGDFKNQEKTLLSNIRPGTPCQVVAVKDSSSSFLQYLQKLNLGIGSHIKILEVMSFDDSYTIENEEGDKMSISRKFAENLFVQ
jgi:DtxR family Mn-dependent transcriptional regulator